MGEGLVFWTGSRARSCTVTCDYLLPTGSPHCQLMSRFSLLHAPCESILPISLIGNAHSDYISNPESFSNKHP